MARKWLIRIVFGVVALAALYFVALLVVGRIADRRLEAELEAIRKKGEPLLLTEMAPQPVPEELNAAEPLLRASKLMVDTTREESDAADELREDPLGCSEPAAEAARAWLDRHPAAIGAIDEALLRPGCSFAYDYSSALSLLEESDFGAFDFIRCADLLMVRGSLEVRCGDVPAAYDSVLDILRLAGFAGSDPIILHAMVRVRCEDEALTLLDAALQSEPPDLERRARLLAALDSIDTTGNLRRALLAERCFGRSLFEVYPDHRDAGGVTGAVAFSEGDFTSLITYVAPSPIFRLDEAWYLEMMSRMIDLQARPAYETRDGWEPIERELKDAPWYALLSRLTLTFVRSIYERTEAHRARLDLARIALDLAHAKKVTGKLPDGLLIPGTESHRGSIDPFSGQDYRYRKTGEDSYLLWSLGRDRKDDGGEDGREDGYDTGDVVWRR